MSKLIADRFRIESFHHYIRLSFENLFIFVLCNTYMMKIIDFKKL